MRILGIVLLAIIALAVIGNIVGPEDSGHGSGYKPRSNPQRDAVVKRFKSSQEKKAKDAMWTSDTNFKVGVLDDGTNRNGYANYVCQVLYDYGFKGKRIKVSILDIAQLARNNKWIVLGEARCQ